MHNKGQTSSYDLLVALFLFLLMFASMRGLWIGNIQVAEKEQQHIEMRFKTIQAMNSLIKTKGYPSNWDTNTVELIGLAERENVLSETKINRFAALDYPTATELLALGNYDFNITITSFNPANDLSVGMPVDQNSTIVSIKRSVKYKGGEADVVFKVFTE